MRAFPLIQRVRVFLCVSRERRSWASPFLSLMALLVPGAALHAQANDNCNNPTLISGIGVFPFNTAGATTSFTGTPRGECFPPGPLPGSVAPATMQNDVWFLWINDTCADPLVQFHTCGQTSGDTMLAAYHDLTACPAAFDHAICCNDDASSITGVCTSGSTQSFISCESSCCKAVLIQIGTKPGSPPISGTFTIDCANPVGCGRPQGCCLPDGTCMEIAPDCCASLGGTPLGFGAHCAGDADDDGFDDACCDPVPDDDIKIDLSTGIDDATAAPIPLAGTDDTWRVMCAASPTLGPVPRQAQVVPQHFAWCAPFGNSQWIGYSPLANTGFPAGDFCYWSCFCLKPGFENASLNFKLRADNGADVYLHNLGPAISHPLVNAPISSHTCNTLTTFSTTDQSLFAAGENCLEVRVHNLGAATGFNLSGELTAEEARCCCAPLPDGSGCRETNCADSNTICRPTEQTVVPGTGQIIVTKCDCLPAPICPGPCDDGLVCNGIEQCHGGKMCAAGDEPCSPGSLCRESARLCMLFSLLLAGEFADCISGPDVGVAAGCGRFDFDDDGDCDLADHGHLQRAFILP